MLCGWFPDLDVLQEKMGDQSPRDKDGQDSENHD